MNLYECPDCRRRHDEPAEATIRLHVRCSDCELASRYHEETILTIVVSRAA
ncbi:MAG: hypothetical protein NVS2B3_14480 [Vulcanimicrobiaceae bacterium]